MHGSAQPFPVLVVDDSVIAHKLVEHALPADQFKILPAKTGLEALDVFAAHRPGLVITDWVMPDLSGIEVCRRLRADFADSFTYVIVLTSNTDTSRLVEALEAGADDYVTKPFNAEELLARVNVGRRFVELHRQLEAKNRFLQQLALTDELTGLPNRRAVEHWAVRQISGAVRHRFPFWVVMADLDEFKSINDTYGHETGDLALKKFGEVLKANTRRCDICGRLGGDEFVLVITHAKEEGIEVVVERIRQQVERARVHFEGHNVAMTASFGIAGFDRRNAADFSCVLVQADVALHLAKRNGRNRVEVAQRSEPQTTAAVGIVDGRED
jgi:two-component system, cell cycle response regulator